MDRMRAAMNTLRGLFPLTLPGAVFLSLSAAAFVVYGVRREDLLLLVLGGMALGLAALGLLGTLVGVVGTLLRLRRGETPAALNAEVGQWIPTDFSLREPRAPFITLRWRWVEPSAEVQLTPRGAYLDERVCLAQRGEHDRVRRAFEVGDCFGLFQVRFTRAQDRGLRVAPSAGALRNVTVIQGIAGGDALEHPDGDPAGDLLDMRRYADGDPVRYILWRVFARSRQLVVRTPERALSPARQTVAYLVAGAADEPAAGAARVAVEAGTLGVDWLLGADGSAGSTCDPQEAMRLIRRSAGAPGGEGLADFLSAGQRIRRALLFCPGAPGPWLEATERAFLENPTLQGFFLVCVDGLERPEPPPPRWRRWAMQEEPRGQKADPAALAEVLRRLGALPGTLRLVDRRAGTVYAAAELRNLMAG